MREPCQSYAEKEKDLGGCRFGPICLQVMLLRLIPCAANRSTTQRSKLRLHRRKTAPRLHSPSCFVP